MGTVDLLGMEPDVPVVRAAGQLVVLAVVPPHQHPEAGGGAELQRLCRPVLFLFSLSAEEARVPQLATDVQKVLFRLCPAQLLQHTLQIVQVPAGKGHLLRQILLRRLGLGVALVVFGGVLLGRQQRVQGNGDRAALRVIEILRLQSGRPPLHAVEVGGDQVAVDPQLVPVLCGGVVLLLHGQFPPDAVPCRGGSPQQVRPPLTHPLLLLPQGVEVIHQGGERVIPDGLHNRAVLGDGAVGEICHLPIFFQADWCKVIFLYISDEPGQFLPEAVLSHRSQVKEMGIRLPCGAEGQFPGDQGGDAEVVVQQKGVHTPLRVCGGDLLSEAVLRLLRHRQAAYGGRRLIIQPRQHLPGSRHVRVHPTEAVDDPALPIQ